MPFCEESCRSSCIYSGPLHSYSRDAVSQHPSTRAGAESIQLIYSGCAVVVCGESQATEKLNAAFNVYKVAHDAEADNARPINQRPRAAAPPVSSSRSIGQGQVAHDGSSHEAASGPASRPQSHGPAQGTSAASDNNIFSHCIIAEENNSFHNWDAGLQFLSDKEISRKLFELRDFTFILALPVGKDCTIRELHEKSLSPC